MIEKFTKIVAMTGLVLLAANAAVEGGKPKFKIEEEHVGSLSREMQREIAGLQYTLNPYQLNHFFSLPSDSLRSEWIDAYWKRLDPTPTTPKNEMMIEHYVRVRLAMQAFESKQWPGWDKRGEVFIRYGAPNYRGKIHSEVTPRKVYPPGEMWFYKKHAMVIQFEDFNLNGHYNYAIKALGVARDMDPELMEFLLYDTEDALQEQIPGYLLDYQRPASIIQDAVDYNWTVEDEVALGVRPITFANPRDRGVQQSIDEIIMDPDITTNLPENPSTTFHLERIKKYANNFEVVLEENPAAYPFNFQDESLTFYFAVDQFKGGENVNRVEVNVEFAADLSPGEEGLTQKAYNATAVFLDANYNEIARETREIVLPTVPAAETDEEDEDDEEENRNERLMPAQLLFTLPYAYYRLAISVEESNTGRASAYKTTMAFNDYHEDLALSDILFASKIAPAERQSPFNRGALEVVPHPLRHYKKGEVVPVYFEVYNLELDDGGLAEFTVEYRIVPSRDRKASFWDSYDNERPIVSSEFESSSYTTTDPLYVSIDTDNLREGAFDLLVTVKDEITQVVVFRRASFVIVK
jgi:GWxTD domain-containing protein